MNTLLDDNQGIDPVAYVRDKFKLAPEVPVDLALAKIKYKAYEFIKMKNAQFDTLSADFQKLKADYDARASLEELLTKAQSRDEPLNTSNANTTQPKVDPLDIEKLVDARLSSYEKQNRAKANVDEAKKVLREKLGSKYADTLRTKMEELDLTEDEMYSLAARSPKAFIRTIGLDDKPPVQNFQSPPSSQYNSATFKPVTDTHTCQS